MACSAIATFALAIAHGMYISNTSQCVAISRILLNIMYTHVLKGIYTLYNYMNLFEIGAGIGLTLLYVLLLNILKLHRVRQ